MNWPKFGALKNVRAILSIFSGSLRWFLISFCQNVVKVGMLVPAKCHGPENSVAGDLAGPRSDSCNRAIGKFRKMMSFFR